MSDVPEKLRPMTVQLPVPVFEALTRAADEAYMKPGTLARQLVAGGLRDGGHLDGPRRHRGARRLEATA